MAFLTGAFLEFLLFKMKEPLTKITVLGIFILLSFFTLRQSYVLSFKKFTEKENRYFYVHTVASAHALEKRVKTLMKKVPEEEVFFLSDENWPYPFLFWNNKKVIFWGRVPDQVNTSLVISKDKQYTELLPKLKRDYIREFYKMRNGVNLQLWIAKDLLE